MKSLNPDLENTQRFGYPVGSVQPAVYCRLFARDGLSYYDYSFDPRRTDNRLYHVESKQHIIEDEHSTITLINNDRAVPENLSGYWVDIGWGMNTPDGIKWLGSDGVLDPRLWVISQHDVSGAEKGKQPRLFTTLKLAGIREAVLKKQIVKLGTAPLYRYDEEHVIPELTDLTIYGVLKYLIETALPAQTGLNTSLEALGDQDDGAINTIVPFPSSGELKLNINADSPKIMQTYQDLFDKLMSFTHCYLIPRVGLSFKIIYPQESDPVDKTYYTTNVKGHPFYQVSDGRFNAEVNHIEIFGGLDEDGNPEFVGDWFDPKHYATPPTRPFTPADIEAAYTGEFMPITVTDWIPEFESNIECENLAVNASWQIKDKQKSSSVIIPMDAAPELGDNIQIEDMRGH